MIEDDFMKEDLTQPPISAIPTYHWSEIQSPRLNGMTIKLLNESIAVTQSVHLLNDYSVTKKAFPAIVVYDVSFLHYKLLEVLAPIICSTIGSSLDETNAMKAQLEGLVSFALTTGLNTFEDTKSMCLDMGILLKNKPSTFLRAFKLYEAKKIGELKEEAEIAAI